MLRNVSLTIIVLIVLINYQIENYTPSKNGGRLVCINEKMKYFIFGFEFQFADLLWLRFLQEVDVYNENRIAKNHLCQDEVFSWHYHLINLAMDLDKNFLEVAANAPILVSISVNDTKGASLLFDKAVKNFPNNWKILFHAAYQALIEEKNQKKAASLLYESGKNGAPLWVYSLAGGLYKEVGLVKIAESIYKDLSEKFPDVEATKRLKSKLENKLQSFHELPNNR